MVEDINEEKGLEDRQVEDVPLDKMTIKELKEIALEIPGLSGVTAMKKEELTTLIKEHKGIAGKSPVAKKQKKIRDVTLSIADIKKKIVMLRDERKAARGMNDRHRVDILRRRINRLKKQTRKIAQA